MNITWIGSPNFTQGREGNRPTGVILHWMVSHIGGADSVFQNRSRNTSAHYGAEDDQVHQYVKEEDTAYHAGNWGVNLQTIGIEHSAEPGRSPSDGTYEISAQIIAAAAKKYGFPIDAEHIRHHYEIVATQCSGQVSNGGVDEDRILRRARELAGSYTPTLAPVPPTVTSKGIATVTVDRLNVRTAPNTSAPLGGSQTLSRGQTFEYQGLVQGQSVSGISTWIHSTRGNYVWAGGTNLGGAPATTPSVQPQNAVGGTAEAIRTTNVRVAPNTGAALGGSRQLQAGQTFGYSALVHGQNVSQNGVTSDLWYHSNVGNYVWSGNCKKV